MYAVACAQIIFCVFPNSALVARVRRAGRRRAERARAAPAAQEAYDRLMPLYFPTSDDDDKKKKKKKDGDNSAKKNDDRDDDGDNDATATRRRRACLECVLIAGAQQLSARRRSAGAGARRAHAGVQRNFDGHLWLSGARRRARLARSRGRASVTAPTLQLHSATRVALETGARAAQRGRADRSDDVARARVVNSPALAGSTTCDALRAVP